MGLNLRWAPLLLALSPFAAVSSNSASRIWLSGPRQCWLSQVVSPMCDTWPFALVIVVKVEAQRFGLAAKSNTDSSPSS